MAKFNFKKGDTVEVIAGDDKGTKAEVLQVPVVGCREGVHLPHLTKVGF